MPGFESGKRSTQLKAQARRLLAESRDAVPVWIMTIARAIDALDFGGRIFDVIIVDEASQCDMLGLLVLGLAKSAIVVGDDKQVSPSAVGEQLAYTQKLIDEYLQELRTRELFTGRFSLYHFATQSFGKPHRLVEHFRCAKPIIEFSNHLCYNGDIRPLRDTSRVQRLPHVVEHRVHDGRRDRDVNDAEALEVASLVIACMEQPEYESATFGVVVMLGDRQAFEIDSLLRAHLPEARYEAARIICGSPPQFQGDERDVVFISMVDSSGDGPLRQLQTTDAEKRYNVAASRAKDQLWIVHSIDDRDLKENDLRLRLLRHARHPDATAEQMRRVERGADSEFERLVGQALTQRGYRIHPQWPVGAMRIDLVAVGADGRRAAIECDGDKYHGLERLADDLERQHVLERLGWSFVRIRGSAFFREPETTLAKVEAALAELGVEPIGAADADVVGAARGDELRERVVRRAAGLRREWAEAEAERSEEDDAAISVPIENSYCLEASPGDPKAKILDCLREADRALGKAEILARAGIHPGQWQNGITVLVADGRVERTGDRRGARYRLVIPAAPDDSSEAIAG